MNSANQNREIIENIVSNQINNMHTALPAIIMSYDAGSNRASVKPIGKYKTADYRSLEFPVIYNVPIQFPTGLGGSAGVTFPISSGDGCLLIFTENQLDDMLSGTDNDDPRKFDLNDAICIPGLYFNGISNSAAYPSEVCLFNGGSMLRLGSSITGTSADGTSFAFSGGDLTVNGISVVHHTHTGDSGGTTSPPK